MTKINRITIHGFKSFAPKTDILFDDRFNCILGPNGSGKSNVGDAICFVLGRLSSKSLRAEKTANLLFNGGKDKKAATSGVVEIVFDNNEKIFAVPEPEVVVSRSISKDGNSTYRINGKKKTRTEVLDLLAAAKINPEGHNIVLQGDITYFVDMSGLERRKIIEQISDVSIYEEKKHKAVLELQKVDDQLNNAEVILKERKTYLKELKKDRDQALQFKELKEKIDSLKATSLHLQIREREEVRDKHDKGINQYQEKINAAEKQIADLKEKINVHKQSIADLNKEIEQRGEAAQVKVHREVEDLKVALAKEKTRVSALKDEINKIQQRRDKFKEELKELEERHSVQNQQQKELQQSQARKRKELQDIEQKIAEFKKKNKIETSHDLEKELEHKDKLIEQKQEEVQQIRQKQQDLLREKDKNEYQLQTLDERIKKVKEVESQNKEQLKVLQQHKNDFKSATLKLNQLLDHDSSFAAQLGNARKKITGLQEQQAKLNAKTMTLQAGLASNQAIKSILDNQKKFKGVQGTIAELGQANKKYSLALETAAGNKMQHLVVDDDETAAECIRFLKNNKLGTASFIPLNKIRTQEISADDKKLLKQEGVHDFALNLVSFKSQFQKAFAHVFGNTIIVDNIDVARRVGVGRIKMATLDGNVAEHSGVMKGGFVIPKHSLGFKEKDSLEELEKVEEELDVQQKIIANLDEKREANEKEIAALRTKKAELEGEVIKLEKVLHLDTADLDASTELRKELEAQLKQVTKSLDEVQLSVSTINRELAELKTKKQMLRSQVTELRSPQLLAQLTAFEETRQKCREEQVQLEGELKASQAQIDQLLAPEREKIQEILKQHEKEQAQFTEEIKQLNLSIAEKEKSLTQKEKESKEFYSKYHGLFNQREKVNAEISKFENEVENIREKSRNSERELNLISLKNAEVKARLAGLQEEFSKFQSVELFTDKSAAEIQQEITKFEVMLGQMSAVNMKALEVYEQVEQEYTKLIEKKDGLDQEKTEVLTFMNELETKKKDHFLKTFDKLNENFQRIFSNLFTKGKAFLQLDNPNNVFEDGVSIKVKLRGNTYLDIRSLSGGEKTLTALSLIFSIQEFQPASFYILDEIDAALDKHNSQTLANLIRSYADRAQYIVISHNDALISNADTLYGVSMNDGVSKITSLRI